MSLTEISGIGVPEADVDPSLEAPADEIVADGAGVGEGDGNGVGVGEAPAIFANSSSRRCFSSM